MNDASLSRQETYLLKEYDSATQLTFHIDELRNRLTSFFVGFGGLAAGALTALADAGDPAAGPLSVHAVAVLLGLIALLAVLVVLVLARLRLVQLEHFVLINNIRTHFMGRQGELRQVVPLNEGTLPQATRRSGTYYWLLLIVVLGAYAGGAAVYLAAQADAALARTDLPLLLAAAAALVLALVMDRLYFAVVGTPPEPYQATER